MGKRYNVGVDIDGVLANFTGAARQLCIELFGKPDPSAVQTGWGFDSLGITKEEEELMWRTIDAQHNWWMSHGVMPNTQYVRALTQEHRVVFITNRKDGDEKSASWPIEEQSQEWLRRNFNIFAPNVIISDKKGPIAEGLKLHYFIDDRPKNVEDVIESYPLCKTYLLDAPYNKECPVTRTFGFDSFAKMILGAY
jgi:5'(3')-deoxyribonucleotidase